MWKAGCRQMAWSHLGRGWDKKPLIKKKKRTPPRKIWELGPEKKTETSKGKKSAHGVGVKAYAPHSTDETQDGEEFLSLSSRRIRREKRESASSIRVLAFRRCSYGLEAVTLGVSGGGWGK